MSALPNPVADILALVVADKSIDTALTKVVRRLSDDIAWRQYFLEESRAFDVPDGPEGDE